MKRMSMQFGKEKTTMIILLALLLILSGCQGTGETADQSITTAVIGTGDIQISAFGSGTLISANQVDLEFVIGGVIDQILIETGDYVVDGESLAVLETDDMQDVLDQAEADLRELTSDAAVAAVMLELAEAQKDVLTAESTLSFYLSPYVFKAEIRLQEAEEILSAAIKAAAENPSGTADEWVAEAQAAVAHAELSLALNYETYYEEYVPDFFNFPWKDQYFDFWHDYYDPPSELEVAVVWAELAAAEARVEEAEYYLAALTEDLIVDDAYGSELMDLENAIHAVAEAREELAAATLYSPIDGVVIEINKEAGEQIGTGVVMTVAKLDPPTLEAWFDEGDWALVKEGNPVELVFDALEEKTYFGEIVFVNPSLQTSQNSTVVSTLVELEVNESGWAGLPLSSGASIEVISGETTDAVLLPIEGLQESSGNQGTVLIASGDEFISREVELGLWDVLFVEVLDGLSAGEVVLIGDLE